MRYTVAVLPAAEQEIVDAFRWYFARSPAAAHAFRTAVVVALDSLQEDPTMWACDPDGVRQYLLRRFPYTIHFVIDGSVVTVLAVAHQRRRPGYWRP